MLNEFLTVLGVVSLSAAAVIVFRKFPQLSVLDTESLPEVQSERKKSEILQDRVARKAAEVGRKVSVSVTDTADKAGKWVSGMQDRLAKMEEEYSDDISQTKVMNPKEKVLALLEEADRLLHLGDLSKAEERYVEAISWDAKEEKAYRGLVKVYVESRRNDQAIETMEFLVKMIRRDNACRHFSDNPEACQASAAAHSDIGELLAQIGQVHFEGGNFEAAKQYFQDTVRVVPINPKYLDQLLEASLRSGDVETAGVTLAKLQSANPDNKKIPSFESRLEELSNNR